MANSKENPPLTELQVKELAELEAKPTRTEKQGQRITELVQKRENSSKVVLSQTAIDYLLEDYAWVTEQKCSITKELEIEQIQKGRLGEKEGRELLSYVDDYYYEKNEERLYNDYLSGEPDTWRGESIRKADECPDIKIIWDYPGFLRKTVKPIEPEYEWQLKGYGILTAAPKLFRAACCVTTPEEVRNSVKMRLFYKRAYLTEEDPDFLKEWAVLERSMIMEGIPHHRRVHKLFVLPATQQEADAILERVKHCREWLNNFHTKYLQLNG